MDITCSQCQGQFRIPDEKAPKNQVFSVGCPKCKNKITVDPRQQASRPGPEKAAPAKKSEAGAPAAKAGLMDEVASGGYDAEDRPFDFLEEGAKTALLCELDPVYKVKMKEAIQAMGYLVTEPGNSRDALKQMRFHVFDLIAVNERFDAEDADNNHVLKFLSRMTISTRRRIFVVLVSDKFRTMDNMAAFSNSVNVLVNPKNIDDVRKILERAVADNEFFYRTYKTGMETAGKL